MPQYDYDLIVLGSGPAGEKGAAQAAYFGKKVAMVEKSSRYGGAAAHTGTLPSKTLRETALVLSGLRARQVYGVNLSLNEATVGDFLQREQEVSMLENSRVEANLRRHLIDQIQGAGTFIDPHTIEITDKDGATRRISGAVVLIATGSSPRRPDNFPFGHDRLWDSDDVLRMPFLPKRLVVIGGGVIGSEYACTFAALGVDVVLVDKRTDFMGFLDRTIAHLLQRRMQDLGVQFVVPDGVKACRADENCAVLELDSGQVLETDAVFVAAGRVSNTGSLNLAAAGITVGQRGLIPVNEHYQTEMPHIYAAGDVIGFPALASTSMEQARLAVVKAFDFGYKEDAVPILPFGIYTIPEVSMAGKTEEEVRDQGIDYVIGTARYGGNPRGLIIGDYDGMLKLIFRREDMRLLGVHVIGEQASELVHIGLIALMCEATSDLFIRTCFNYPTLGDLYKYATYEAMGRLQSADAGDSPLIG